MPFKVKLVVGLASISTLVALLSSQWIPLLISCALIAAVLEARYDARSEMLVVLRLAILGAAVVVAVGAIDVLGGDATTGVNTVTAGVLSLLPAAFYRWCLDQLDVVRWMLHRQPATSRI